MLLTPGQILQKYFTGCVRFACLLKCPAAIFFSHKDYVYKEPITNGFPPKGWGGYSRIYCTSALAKRLLGNA